MRTRFAKLAHRSAFIGALGLGVGLLAACASKNSVDALRLDPTPEVMTSSQTGDDVANATTITFDTNWRQFNEDLGRFFLVDQPTRLVPRAVPH